MKINKKIPLLTIGSILLIANAIQIGRYLSEKQTTNGAIKSTTISTGKTSNMAKEKKKNAHILPTSVLGKTSVPWTPFAEMGPTTNLKIKVRGPGTFWGTSMFTYFLKYYTWEKKSIIQSNGTIAPTWTAVSHEVTVGGDDVKNIEVSGLKIADTEIRIKSSGKGWAKMIANPDLIWPASIEPTLSNTTYSIDSDGSTLNPNVSFWYHVMTRYGHASPFLIATYDNFSFSQWLMRNLVYVIIGIIALCIVIASILIVVCTYGAGAPLVCPCGAAITSEILEEEAVALTSVTNESFYEYEEAVSNFENSIERGDNAKTVNAFKADVQAVFQ